MTTRVSTGSAPVLNIDSIRRATESAAHSAVSAEHVLGPNCTEAQRCQFDGSKITEEMQRLMPSTKRTRCREQARWAVQLDYFDHKSPETRLCSVHFTMLPPSPQGRFYRVRRIR